MAYATSYIDIGYGQKWPIEILLFSLTVDRELGETEWWRRMAILQNTAAQTKDDKLLDELDKAKERRWGSRFPQQEVTTPQNLPPFRSQDEEAIDRFNKLTEQARLDLLRDAMKKLLEAKNVRGVKIFCQKQQWMGIYLVLRDRLGVRLSQKEFTDFAIKITPYECPDKVKISENTMTNFSKKIIENKVYYEMKHNPFSDVCDAFWNLVKMLILTKK